MNIFMLHCLFLHSAAFDLRCCALGEMGHHDVLLAAALGVSVILTEHTNTERGFLPHMAKDLQTR